MLLNDVLIECVMKYFVEIFRFTTTEQRVSLPNSNTEHLFFQNITAPLIFSILLDAFCLPKLIQLAVLKMEGHVST